MKQLVLVSIVFVFSACTSAGPFVMSISSDGDSGLIMEKCNVKLNAFMGTVSNHNCTTTQLKINRQ